ncbi:uncharacterized protein [Diadema setosum]|uniref:uncharacterized protein n=1 Tax=Diadema setosum TaxID=31175 RepID=UPI003B3A2C46
MCPHRCHYDVDVIQSYHVGNSPIISSPLVADIDANGHPDIVIATFDGTISIVEGGNLKPHSGSHWPNHFTNSTIHARPILFDVDGDGHRDIVICTTDGAVMYISPDGSLLHKKTLQIPPMYIARRWFQDGRSLDEGVSDFVKTTGNFHTKTSEFIACDAHILATPTLADLNRDGRKEELALPVSYYDELDSLRTDSPGDILPDVVGSALVILNLTSGEVIRQIPLHLSKKSAPVPAYLLHSPTVVDLDGNHDPPEVVMATASGLVVAVDVEGQTRSGFPVRLGEPVSGQISVGDLDGDGNLEIVALHTTGKVTCLSNHGNKKWSAQISGTSFPGSRLADLDGDTIMDVIIPSDDGYVWVLSGQTGNPLPKWPVYVGSRLVSNVVITILSNTSQSPDIVVTSYDGNMYIIATSGEGPCVEDIDLAERSLTPLQIADIIPSTPELEIVAATMHGSILLMSTSGDDGEGLEDSDLLRENTAMRWSGSTNDNEVLFRNRKYGVFVTVETKLKTYISGASFTVDFDIEDDQSTRTKQTYIIQVSVGSISLHPPTLFTRPGRHSLQVAAPVRPITALIEVHMTNNYKQDFSDAFAASFNTKVVDDIQWLLAIPTIAMAIILLILYGFPEVDLLPQLHSSKDR